MERSIGSQVFHLLFELINIRVVDQPVLLAHPAIIMIQTCTGLGFCFLHLESHPTSRFPSAITFLSDLKLFFPVVWWIRKETIPD
jgi:hypothetical protein